MSDKSNSLDSFLEEERKEGGKKKVTTKKPAAKKTVVSDKKKVQKVPKKSVRSSKKKGGDLMGDVQKLAVPFAILLAKQGVQAMFEESKKGNSSGNAVSSSPSESVVSSSSKNSKNSKNNSSSQNGGMKKKQAGGTGCPSCQTVTPMTGGSKSKKTVKSGGTVGDVTEKSIKEKYNDLASRIEQFLSRY